MIRDLAYETCTVTELHLIVFFHTVYAPVDKLIAWV
ncbi:hypothetical protein BpOF4_10685 [Alkalihalophilus pseudofirmus OF4]|uniref:Uncharacterized protein n=1 Tax=Alkalihalophilus pseudofirmus (strain ATCC BAA-2126 / JCM 17055 / OF4) TaxID=398511 RepID=D3FUM0_ALKPO|nr:hypothetical protein BpOF4_10685 [Alkalihalophilus pseudofirmus OF4]